MLYDINGTEIENAYDIQGTSKDTLYDIEGNAIELVKPTTFSILGDSYSTFTGDFLPKNLTTGQSYWTWYDGTKNGVTDKTKTWYRLFEAASGWKLDINASCSGSPICYDGYGDGTTDAAWYSFVNRALETGDSDYIFVFGATNDSSVGVSQGDYKYSNWTEEDMQYFRPAFAKLLYTLKQNRPNSKIYFIKNTGLSSAVSTAITVITTQYNIPVIALSSITKSSGHPTDAGMVQIKNQVMSYLGLS